MNVLAAFAEPLINKAMLIKVDEMKVEMYDAYGVKSRDDATVPLNSIRRNFAMGPDAAEREFTLEDFQEWIDPTIDDVSVACACSSSNQRCDVSATAPATDPHPFPWFAQIMTLVDKSLVLAVKDATSDKVRTSATAESDRVGRFDASRPYCRPTPLAARS